MRPASAVGGVPSPILPFRVSLFLLAMVWILSVISPPVVTAQSGTAQTTQARQPTQQKKVTPEEEFKALLQKAEQGDAQAQFNLGVVYAYGLVGVPQDSAQALAWYRKAAEQGSG